MGVEVETAMKLFAFIAAFLAIITSSFANSTNSLGNFSPLFSANTQIFWLAPTNHLPKSLWIYRRLPPQPFSASVISNAVMLAFLRDKGFPKSSTNTYYVWSAPNPCGVRFSIFSIEPASTTISFSSPKQSLSTNDVPDDETVTRRAFEYAARFGLGQGQVVPENIYSVSTATGSNRTLTNGICGRGITLARKLDGVSFFAFGKGISQVDGFSIEFGGNGQIRSFSLVWPNLKRFQNSAVASPREIIRCIRERKVLVLPEDGGPNYFRRLKTLADARTLTITSITPHYGEGVFGETPASDQPPQLIIPFAELEAVADFGNSNMTVRLLSPVLRSEVVRLTDAKVK